MTTSPVNDSRCATCGKVASTFTCRGCSKDFCLQHTNTHRQELTKEMDEDIIPIHDQIRQILHDQTKNPAHHPLMKQIDEWEHLSIEKIHSAADDARQQLSQSINKHMSQMKEKVEGLTQQLKKARDDDHFFEADLKQWRSKLDTLRKNLMTPQTINIFHDDHTIPFISRILIGEAIDVLNEYFEQSLGNIQIAENGRVIIHQQANSYASVRGRCEYSSGEYRLRFLIENLSDYKWIFFGIVSKNASTLVTQPTGDTSYGFSGQDSVWRDGTYAGSLNSYKSDFEAKDTIELSIDCDQRKIRLVNERTRKVDTLDVDIVKCRFPWKLSVGFYHKSGESVRILS